MAGSTAALLHNKVDKVVRVVDQTSENQKKMNRVLQDLIKFGGLISKEQGTHFTNILSLSIFPSRSHFNDKQINYFKLKSISPTLNKHGCRRRCGREEV